MENPKVSVIIPVYNVEKYLSACIESVLAQTLQNIEIICVNDGSSDSSLEILQRFAEKDSRLVVINQENAGAGAARNRGLDAARGTYIGFVDSDDFIAPDMYEVLCRRAECDDSDLVLNGEIKLSTGEIHYFTDAITMYNMEKSPFTAEMYPIILNSCFLWNRLYKKSFLKAHRIFIPEGRKFAEDLLFCTQTSVLAQKISLVGEPYYTYILHEGSLTDSLNKKKDKSDYLKAMHETKLFLQNEEKYPVFQKDFLSFTMNIAFPLLESIQQRKYSEDFFQGLSAIVDSEDLEVLRECGYSNRFPRSFEALQRRNWKVFWKNRR